MVRTAAVSFTAALFLLSATGDVRGASRDLLPGPPDETISRMARGGKPLWKIPLGQALIEDMRFISPDRLIVGTRRDSPGLPGQDLLLVDASSGRVVWRLDRSRSGGDFRLLTFESGVLVYGFTGRKKDGHRLLALNADTGTEMWSIPFKSPDTGFFPAPASRVVLAAVRGKTGLQLHCVTAAEGSVRWRRQLDAGGRQGLPYILSSGDDAWLLHETATRLSMVDGRDLWLRDDLAVPPDGPPPVLDGDDLLLFDVKGQLVRVAAGTGETRWAIRMPDGFQPSAISPGGRIVFVRGLEPGSGAGGHLLLALSRADGSKLWSFAAPEPVMSNIVQREGRVYFGTTSSLIALDAGSGDRVFQSRATGAGWLYPVKLRDYPDRIVYTSEFTAAGFDPSSGKRLFSHGVSPVSSEADLAALDAAIPRLKGEVEKLGKEKTDFGSSYAFGQMTHFQSQADYYRMRGDRGMEAKYRSDADFQRSFFLYFGTAEVIVDIGRILEMRSIEASIDRQMLFRSSILRSCSLGEIGDYVVRADRKWVSEADDFIGVTVVHLPTGKAGFTVLSPAYMSYGLWNLVDFERKVVLHHGIGLNPSDYEYSNAREIFPYGKVRTINTYLIAWPITLPR